MNSNRMTQLPDSDCCVCWRLFGAEIPPYSLPCGHSVCLDCVSRLKACPLCKLRLSSRFQPVKNYQLLSLAERLSMQTAIEKIDKQVQTEAAPRVKKTTTTLPVTSATGPVKRQKTVVRLKRATDGSLRSIELLLQ